MSAAADPWPEALAALDRLLDLPADARAAELAGLPPPVRELAVKLLEAEAGGSLLDEPLAPPVLADDDSDADGEADEPLAGRRLGRWLLLEPLGRGGMSVVWRARSVAPPLGQVAAVKLLALGAASREGRARFEREAETLARLRHPGIAPLYEAGTADDGTPWFAMAVVDGLPADRWCRERAAPLARRVDLCVQAAEAVAHAHRHLVVHRDLKPGNLLVDAEGRATLVDFGIARWLEPEAGTATVTTAYTPSYAAPEQLAGAELTTATDVYGLAALLHRLLLGQPPERGPGGECSDPARLADAVSEPAEAAPDRAALRRALRGDLGWILRKALAAEPARRYASAAEFGADLRAWSEGRPVAARQGGQRYRLRKWIQRHRAAAVLLGALAVSVLAGVAGTWVQAERARAEAQRAGQAQRAAEQALARAESVRSDLLRVFHGSRPQAGGERSASQLLDQGEAIARERAAAGDALLAADLLAMVGDARNLRGEYAPAEALQRQALALLDGLPDGGPPRTRVRVLHALARAGWTTGRSDEGLALYAQALPLLPAAALPLEEALEIRLSALVMRSSSGRHEQPVQPLRELAAEVAAGPVAGGNLHLRVLNALSTTLVLAGTPDDGELLDQRLALAARVHAGAPDQLATTYADALPSLRRRRDFERAQSLADEALRLARAAYDRPHVVLAMATCNAAGLALQRGRPAPALALLEETAAIDRALQRRHLHAVSCRLHHAQALAALDRPAEAQARFDETWALLQTLGHPPEHPWWRLVCDERVALALRAGQPARARAAQADCQAHPGGPRPTPQRQLLAAELALADGRLDEAARLLADWSGGEAPPTDAPDRLGGWQLRWALAAARGDAAEAARLQQALQAAARAMPAPWAGREALLDCLQRPPTAGACLPGRTP